MSHSLLTVGIGTENDLVVCRQRSRLLAGLLGFESQDQTRIATAVSEIARNAFRYAGKGKIEFILEGTTLPQVFVIRITDRGPGIRNLQNILDGQYQSTTGMGLGLIGARRLMDQCDIQTEAGTGTAVSLKKLLPRRSPLVGIQRINEIAATIARTKPQNLLEEIQQQNGELLQALEELRRRQEELSQLNHELEDTNRGVVALYAELEEKADHLRRADEVKSRFLSNMSHEFRTPLNSVTALSRLLLDRIDGELSPEQEKQVQYIRKSAESLTELVNDLLDLAKVEAGRVTINSTQFTLDNLFGALRGMLRPLLVSNSLNLVFEDVSKFPAMNTDEGKVSQILRNFISNALKFTERGEIRVSAKFDEELDLMRLSVADTGLGISAAHLETIFEEFAQVDSPIQRRVRGTGLGLPLSKKLAELLGGTIVVQSEPGRGSTFTVALPRYFQNEEEVPLGGSRLDPERMPVLIVEDNDETRMIYEAYLRNSPFQVIPARSVQQASKALRDHKPAAVILDVLLNGEDTWNLLAEMKSQPVSKSIPVIVATTVDDRGKAMALGADSFAQKPLAGDWLLQELKRLTLPATAKVALLIDDEEIGRYLVRQFLGGTNMSFIEASSGEQGIKLAVERHPDFVFLDLSMPGLQGAEVLNRLKDDSATSNIPVVIVTSHLLTDHDLSLLNGKALAVMSKADLGVRKATDRFPFLAPGANQGSVREFLRSGREGTSQ